jgi:large conductance mechanosensitive channel
MLKEFKQFILKGNVVDLSTGVIIGAAFTTIVSAFTKGVVEPILALVTGGSSPEPDIKIPIMKRMMEEPMKNAAGKFIDKTGAEVADAAAAGKIAVEKLITLDVGIILGALISFLITAAIIFFVIVKPANKLMAMMKKEEAAAPPPEPPADVKLLGEIRDLLAKR